MSVALYVLMECNVFTNAERTRILTEVNTHYLSNTMNGKKFDSIRCGGSGAL